MIQLILTAVLLASPPHNITIYHRYGPAYLLAPLELELLVAYDGNLSQPVEAADIVVTMLENGEVQRLTTSRNGYAKAAASSLLTPRQSFTIHVEHNGLTADKTITIDYSLILIPVYSTTVLTALAAAKMYTRSTSKTKRKEERAQPV